MKTKTEKPAFALVNENLGPILRFYLEINQLKELYRQGWLKRGIADKECESVAEHTFAMAILTMVLAPEVRPDLNICRTLMMALVHDLGEVYTGDLTPEDGISPAEKFRMEMQAVERISAGLLCQELILGLWQEYEAGETAEAQFVRQIDRLEMGMQAGVYQLRGADGMDEFFASAHEALHDQLLVSLLADMQELAATGGV